MCIEKNQLIDGSIPQFDGNIIYEDCAFHKLPRAFADALINEIKNMKSNKIVEKEIDIRPYLKLIKCEEVENVKQFYDFIQMLINSSEKILTLRMGFENSFTEPIILYELADANYTKIFHDEPFKTELIKKIKSKSMSDALQIMKDNLTDIIDLGTLIINPHTITDSKFEYDNDDTIIGHEIRHFIIFLQRFSKLNYDVCKRYSAQDLPEYDRNNPDFKLYSLNEDEFITLSSTYIERLVNLFLKHKRTTKIQEVNLLIKSLLVKAGEYPIEQLENDLYWYELLDENTTQIKNIIQFYKNILDDRKYKLNAELKFKNDKFLTLSKWTYNTFYEKLKELRRK